MLKIELQKSGNLEIQVDKEYSIDTLTHMLMNAQLHVMREVVKKLPLAKKEEAKAQIYDMVNLRMSSVLASFAPEFEAREGLTEEAILRMEDQILKERTDEMSKMPQSDGAN